MFRMTSQHESNVSSLSVAIIGGGLGGIVTAKALNARGIKCTVFEQQSKVGGLWVENYPGASVQASKTMYEYPEKRYSADTPYTVPAADVVKYAEEFIDEHQIKHLIQFNTKVTAIEQHSNKEWVVKYHTITDNPKIALAEKTSSFSNIVMSNGLFSSHIHIPNNIPGKELFKGTQLHTSEWKDISMFKDKNVIIIGNGKSGFDVAIASGKVSKQTHHVIRTKHWYIPSWIFGFVNYASALQPRASCALLPSYYDVSIISHAIRTLVTPFLWLYWRSVECLFLAHYRFPVKLWPEEPLERDALSHGTLAYLPGALDGYRNGEIVTHPNVSVKNLQEDGVTTSDGNFLQADIVIWATGWTTKMNDLLPDSIVSKLDVKDDGMTLYRNIIHPNVPGLAFVGALVTYTSPATFSLQAAWLAEYLSGSFLLPEKETMLKDIEDLRANRERYYPKSSIRGSSTMAHLNHYHDQLIRDYGSNPMRYGGGIFSAMFMNWMMPPKPEDFHEVVKPQSERDDTLQLCVVSKTTEFIIISIFLAIVTSFILVV
jgi:dimethylaniline monooxygenase (N-oxide forming)